ncbi:histidinol-phosphatase HisJ [Paenisporosarcina cavernae]|uniref:Histidinol-phosphatase n=1 Tax=Paenisporosarcina cavernae TaxID=2320858 RepID=A0A385YRS5_9BACL|nr:histidinol-phosphatase HisJ [Paenisporosarcina cavernae]AYC28448.1 histidinol-phosphatase HisJ [Paenisporosarcina cavernae]
MIRDGHVHTHYCPHGTNDPMRQYVERALALGYHEITFTEHAPLPEGFVDPVPKQDSAMDHSDLEFYVSEVEALKAEFAERIKVNVGLEVDFIEGFEKETTMLLNEIGPRLDDAILSVHFLRNAESYDCIDYSPDVFGELVSKYGSVDSVYARYFATVKKSIEADVGNFKPKRIGHITLVHKFQQKFAPSRSFEHELLDLLALVQAKGYELDYNGAGLLKPLCRETYPPLWVIKEAKRLGIPLVYGSDAHQVSAMHFGVESIDL